MMLMALENVFKAVYINYTNFKLQIRMAGTDHLKNHLEHPIESMVDDTYNKTKHGTLGIR